MGRLVFMLRHRLPVIIFVVAAIIGGVLIFWYINNKEESNSTGQEYAEIQENLSINGDEDVKISGEDISSEDHGKPFSSSIPYGLRAASLPISFFGDVSAISEGDRVDIISVFYDPDSNELYSEVILSQKEIVLLGNTGKDQEQEAYQDKGGSGYFGDGVLGDLSSGNVASGQLKKIFVITFYLEVTEVKRAFKAIEGGQLYLSLCPADSGENGY